MLNFLKLIKFIVLFYYTSSDQSKVVDLLKSKSLTRYHVHHEIMKTVTKTSPEKLQYKSETCYCTIDMLHFRVALLICKTKA